MNHELPPALAIGINIRAERKRQKMTLEELAKKAGISRSTLQRVEGSDDIRITTLSKIAKALKVKLASLLEVHEPS